MTRHQIMIDTTQCVGCGRCQKVCPAHNIIIEEQRARTILADCLFCGQCTAVCPQRAIVISGYADDPIEKKGDMRLKPDEVLEVIRFRRTIRQFKAEKIPQSVLEQILEAGRLTHTAKNKQDIAFIVLDKEKDHVERSAVRLLKWVKPLADLVSPMARNVQIDDHFFFFKAPLVIIILADEPANGLLAAQNMEFVAEANGLGVLFSGYFTKVANLSFKIKRALHMPKGKRVAATLVLGYPAVRFLRSVQREPLKVNYL